MKLKRHFTKDIKNLYDCVSWKEVSVSIRNEMTGAEIAGIQKAEVPASFNDIASQTLTTKYFRLTEVPTSTIPIPEKNAKGQDVPAWLQRREAEPDVQNNRRRLLKVRRQIEAMRAASVPRNSAEMKSLKEERSSLQKMLSQHLGGELSGKQVFHRLAGFWAYTGFMNGYFDTEEDAKIYYEEMFTILATQRAAPNTPQWFNSGLWWAYGLEGEAKGFWRVDPVTKQPVQTTNYWQYPGLHACLTAGAPIMMSDGSTKPIEAIVVGDQVITHRNRARSVVAVNSRNADSRFDIKFEYIGSVGCTIDHKWLGIVGKDADADAGSGKDIKVAIRPRMIRTDKLVVGDYIKVSHPQFGPAPTIDLSQWSLDEKLPHTHQIPDSIEITPDLARLIGYYLAEGDNDRDSYIRFTTASHEEDMRADIIKLMREYFGLEGSLQAHTTTNSIAVRFTSVRLAKAFGFLFGVGANNKRIPQCLITAPRQQAIELLRGLIKGDGCVHAGYLRFAVVSRALRDQFHTLLLKLGCVGGLKTRHYLKEDQVNWKPLYSVVTRASYLTEVFGPAEAGQVRHFKTIDGDTYVKIKSIAHVPGSVRVYDFEVQEDHSFSVAGLTSSNCHIMGVSDSLFEENGIYDNLTIEARAFATGGGVGKNISNLRSRFEYLSNGNKVTGSHEFALIDDRSAGAIKSGSTQRKAAKMVISDMDDPEVVEFIDWKGVEERKVAALAAAGFSDSFEGPAYKTVSGQNSNNSVRIPRSFLLTMERGEDWHMTARTTGEVVRTEKARMLWDLITKNAWASGDPGLQFEDIIQEWNTCAVDGRIRATNPCAEYIFLDNTSCNLFSMNCQRFFSASGRVFYTDDFIFTSQLCMITLDISIEASQLPSKQLAVGTHNYRTTGLGHTGIGAVLMRAGIPYDSVKACHIMAGVTALMHAQTWLTSAQLAASLGTFPRYEPNKDCLARVLRNHARASVGNPGKEAYEGLSVKPWEIDKDSLPDGLHVAIARVWRDAQEQGKKHGYRNAFTTVIQPSGTVGLVMNCDTTSLEPDYGIIKYKKLAGGGSMKIVNESLELALKNLGYSEEQCDDIMVYVLGNNTLDGAPCVNDQTLLRAGFTQEDVDKIENHLEGAVQLYMVVNASRLSDQTLENLGLNRKKDRDLNLFQFLGVSKEDYIEANKWICGHGTLEGAPHLKPEHLPIFDCANASGYGKRYIAWEGHIRAMSAVSPFISGGISKTINMPNDATQKDIEAAYLMSFDGRGAKSYCPGGIKCIALYRDGSKRAQPLNNPTDMGWWDKKHEAKVYLRGERKRLPKKRLAPAHDVTINDNGHHTKFIIKFGEYEDGQPGEIWIDFAGQVNPEFVWAMKLATRAMSNALQYGISPEELASSYLGNQGGPAGRTDHPYITHCTSIIDFVMKLMLLEYRGDTTYCTKRPRPQELRIGMITKTNTKTALNGHANGNGHNGKNRLALAEILTETTVLVHPGANSCPKCGSSNIQKFPCPTCLNCSASLGGCTA